MKKTRHWLKTESITDKFNFDDDIRRNEPFQNCSFELSTNQNKSCACVMKSARYMQTPVFRNLSPNFGIHRKRSTFFLPVQSKNATYFTLLNTGVNVFHAVEMPRGTTKQTKIHYIYFWWSFHSPLEIH